MMVLQSILHINILSLQYKLCDVFGSLSKCSPSSCARLLVQHCILSFLRSV